MYLIIARVCVHYDIGKNNFPRHQRDDVISAHNRISMAAPEITSLMAWLMKGRSHTHTQDDVQALERNARRIYIEATEQQQHRVSNNHLKASFADDRAD